MDAAAKLKKQRFLFPTPLGVALRLLSDTGKYILNQVWRNQNNFSRRSFEKSYFLIKLAFTALHFQLNPRSIIEESDT